jgi:hypothetical protein
MITLYFMACAIGTTTGDDSGESLRVAPKDDTAADTADTGDTGETTPPPPVDDTGTTDTGTTDTVADTFSEITIEEVNFGAATEILLGANDAWGTLDETLGTLSLHQGEAWAGVVFNVRDLEAFGPGNYDCDDFVSHSAPGDIQANNSMAIDLTGATVPYGSWAEQVITCSNLDPEEVTGIDLDLHIDSVTPHMAGEYVITLTGANSVEGDLTITGWFDLPLGTR